MRFVNRLLAAILALVIAGAGLLTATEVLVVQAGWVKNPPLVVPYDQWLTTLRAHTWKDTSVLLIAIGALVLGLLLILAAIAGRDRTFAMLFGRPEVHPTTTRRSLSRTLQHEAAAVDGVGSARAKVRRRRAKVKAQARLGDPDAVAAAVRTAVGERLDGLPLQKPPTLSVRVTAARRRT